MSHAYKTLAALWVALVACAVWAAADEAPFLTGRVVDNAEVLSGPARAKLAALLKAHETETTEQIVVLTVPTLGGRSIEEYALAVFEAWKLGQKGKDNGVLVVIVPPERKMRIEVGYGLEGRLTDVEAARIIRNVMAPRFKSGEFDAGVEEGVRVILAKLKGETSAIPDANAQPQSGSSRSALSGMDVPDLPIIERILFGAFIFGIIGLFTVIGVLTPGVGWFLYLFLIPFWAMFPIVVVGVKGALILLVTYLVVFPLAKLIVSRTGWYEKAKHDLKTKGRATVGGFALGGASAGSSWSSGSGSSGGGFSGGGGSSGGGGASGSW
jgi:uncharacterized protein